MTSPADAHWVVVTGITDTKDGPKLQVQSWGAYHEVKWNDIKDNWRRGYGRYGDVARRSWFSNCRLSRGGYIGHRLTRRGTHDGAIA